LHYKINADVVLPQTILNFGEYQAKLQKLAMFSEQADHKAMQDILDNTEVIDQKNTMLQPLFRDIKAHIRHMTHTPEFDLMREYVQKKKLVERSMANSVVDKTKQKEVLDKLQLQYAKLLSLRQRKL
jgi:hypothetical protein